MKRIIIFISGLLVGFVLFNALLYWLMGSWYWPFMFGFGVGVVGLMVFRIIIYRINKIAAFAKLGTTEEAEYLRQYLKDAKRFKILDNE